MLMAVIRSGTWLFLEGLSDECKPQRIVTDVGKDWEGRL